MTDPGGLEGYPAARLACNVLNQMISLGRQSRTASVGEGPLGWGLRVSSYSCTTVAVAIVVTLVSIGVSSFGVRRSNARSSPAMTIDSLIPAPRSSTANGHPAFTDGDIGAA